MAESRTELKAFSEVKYPERNYTVMKGKQAKHMFETKRKIVVKNWCI